MYLQLNQLLRSLALRVAESPPSDVRCNVCALRGQYSQLRFVVELGQVVSRNLLTRRSARPPAVYISTIRADLLKNKVVVLP